MHKEEFINDTEKHENFAGIWDFCRLANFCFVGTIVLCFKIAKNFAGNQFCNFFRKQNVNKQESTTFFFNHTLGYSKLFLLTISRNLRTFQHKDYHRYLVCIFLNLNWTYIAQGHTSARYNKFYKGVFFHLELKRKLSTSAELTRHSLIRKNKKQLLFLMLRKKET